MCTCTCTCTCVCVHVCMCTRRSTYLALAERGHRLVALLVRHAGRAAAAREVARGEALVVQQLLDAVDLVARVEEDDRLVRLQQVVEVLEQARLEEGFGRGSLGRGSLGRGSTTRAAQDIQLNIRERWRIESCSPAVVAVTT